MQKSESTKKDSLGRAVSLAALSLIVIVVVSIFAFVMSRGLSTFFHDGVHVKDFLFGSTWNPSVVNPQTKQPYIGALPMILGSFLVTFLAAIVATPFAIGTSLFMTEIAQKRGAKIMQPIIELLVGIPSVVYGWVGISVLVPFIKNNFGGMGYSLLSGILVLSLMVLPTIATLCIDAIKTIPQDHIEASYGLGATRWQTIYKVIVPGAKSGILTGVVLGIARAFGEALAVQMVIGNTVKIPDGILSSMSTLTSVITMDMANTVGGTMWNNALWSLALILLIISFGFILLVRFIGKRCSK